MSRADRPTIPPQTEAELTAYLERQAGVEYLRRRLPPEFPWPDADSPMLKYLVDQAATLVDTDGLGPTLVWLAVHAWFEGAIEGTCNAGKPSRKKASVIPQPSHSG